MSNTKYKITFSDVLPPHKPSSGIAHPPVLTDEDEKILDRIYLSQGCLRTAGELSPAPPKPMTPFRPPSKREKAIT